jgi:peptidoglycan/LPS O-acetylase OafA/YrhL
LSRKTFTIGDYSTGRINNFDIIRFFAATLVVYSHAFPIATGKNLLEPLKNFSNSQTTFGHLGVLIFFVISGFLITQSFDRNNNAASFAKGRFLRIFPALIVVIFLTVFVIGLFYTTLSTREYLTNAETYKYLFSIFLYPMQHTLPGVFEQNPYPLSINGSLWTLPIEFTFYFAVLFLGLTKLLNKKFIILLFMLSLILPELNIPVGEDYINLFRYFVAGSFFYLFKDRIQLNIIYALISFIAILLSLLFGQFDIAFAFFGSYLIFYLAYNQNIKFHNFSKIGDASYGLYIYAFPIQQIVSYIFKTDITPVSNFLISLPITIVLAYSSWHLIEKPMLKMKKTSFIFISNKKISRQL